MDEIQESSETRLDEAGGSRDAEVAAPRDDHGAKAADPAGDAPAAGRRAGVEVVEPRRRDRGKDDAWIRAFLERAPVAFLAIPGEERPHVNSNLFVYDDTGPAIYMHTARTGAMPDALSEPVPVTFSAVVMGRLLPADEALEFSVEYAGVVVHGRASTVDDPEEAEGALQMLLDKYAPHLRPGRDYRPIVPEELKRTAVYRIDIDRWSGKEKSVEAGFPGAFRLDPPEIPFLPGTS